MRTDLIPAGRACASCGGPADGIVGCPRCGANQRLEGAIDRVRHAWHGVGGLSRRALAWVGGDVLRLVWALALVPFLMGPALGAVAIGVHHLATRRPRGRRAALFVAACLLAVGNLCLSYRANVAAWETVHEWAAGLVDIPSGSSPTRPGGARVYKV